MELGVTIQGVFDAREQRVLEPGGARVGVFCPPHLLRACERVGVGVGVVPFVSRPKGNSTWVHASFVAVSWSRSSDFMFLLICVLPHSSFLILNFLLHFFGSFGDIFGMKMMGGSYKRLLATTRKIVSTTVIWL